MVVLRKNISKMKGEAVLFDEIRSRPYNVPTSNAISRPLSKS